MKHHFADFLDRDGEYWTIIPNSDRYEYSVGDVPTGSKQITIVTVGRDEKNWERIFSFPNLEELTLHEPTKEQLQSTGELSQLKRLRITHSRPKDIEFIAKLEQIEELVLEYVSGFSDLSPLQNLLKLRSLHIENLRRVTDFEGLSGIQSLLYLSIYGTLDWKQPIGNFEFLAELPSLEVFALWQVVSRQPYPALRPLVNLKNLKTLKIPNNIFATEEYALVETGLPAVDGAKWDVCSVVGDWIPLSNNDIRSKLPVEVLRTKYPEVLIGRMVKEE